MKTKFFRTGGAINPDQHVYIERATDKQVFQALQQGNHVNLHAGRQAGKTTLMLSLKQQLQAQGHLCVDIDLTGSSNQYPSHLLDCIASLAYEVNQQLPAPNQTEKTTVQNDNIRSLAHSWLQSLVTSTNSSAQGKRLYLMLDEVDSLMRYPCNEVAQFFLAIREFVQHPDKQQDRLVLLLVSVMTPNEMIHGEQTDGVGVNFFRDSHLPLFSQDADVVKQLQAQGFPQHPEIKPLLNDVLELTGGQPFLTALLCQELQTSDQAEQTFKTLRHSILHEARSLASNHLFGMRKQLMVMGERLFSVLQTYKRIAIQQEKVNAHQGGWNAASLENIGLISLDKNGYYQIANPIYAAHFDATWIDELETEYEIHQSRKSLQETGQRQFPNRRVALILCGGTVGMITRNGKSNFQGADDVLNHFIHNEPNRIAEIVPHTLYRLDGINMMPEHWVGVAKLIDKLWEQYDGFVVAQGTDTLAMTASGVSMMLGRITKPVVFTAAQTSLDVLHGDARDNLMRACFVAAHPNGIQETQICFADQVLRAVRTEKTDDRIFPGFDSPGWPALARVTENLLIQQHALLEPVEKRSEFKPYLAQGLLYINLVPGLNPEDYKTLIERRTETGQPVPGIIITTPGLGNIPSKPPYNFRDFIQFAVRQYIPVLISSQMPITPYTQGQYDSASVPAQYGAIPAGNLTVAAALTKFSWVIGNVNRAWQGKPKNDDYMSMVKEFMRHNYVGEEGDFAHVAPINPNQSNQTKGH